MRECSAELWSWLQDGAHLFVCGAERMARDVDQALGAIIARQVGMTTGTANAYLATLSPRRALSARRLFEKRRFTTDAARR